MGTFEYNFNASTYVCKHFGSENWICCNPLSSNNKLELPEIFHPVLKQAKDEWNNSTTEKNTSSSSFLLPPP